MSHLNYRQIVSEREKRAEFIARVGGLEHALRSGVFPEQIDLTLSEAIVLGLMRQGVKKYIGVLGHGSTEIGEVLRVYEQAGLVKTYNVRNEISASHSAMALRWVTGEKAAVITSIGPGALHALSGSLAAASDGVGVWYLFGDETTEDEGPNFQQIPKNEQHLFLKLCQVMGRAYCLETPNSVATALRRGANTVDHPYKAGPFYLLLPMNTQCALMEQFNLSELPCDAPPKMGPARSGYAEAIDAIRSAQKIVVRVGGGCQDAAEELQEFIELTGSVAVISPKISGIIPYDHPQNMTVGGSKGSLCGNYAMEEADLLIAVGTRFVCQSDCSRTGYPKVQKVININVDIEDVMHYNKAIPLLGDVKLSLAKLNEDLRKRKAKSESSSRWLSECRQKKQEWEIFKQTRYNKPTLWDNVWGRDVLTQPAAIKTVVDWAREINAVSFFDSGDIQANGFQIVEDDRLGRTFTETGASYMGWAVSALMATVMADRTFYGVAFTGDGAFTMNPQILIDGVEHGAKGCIVVFDNRRMAAISGLQKAQFGIDYATNDSVGVDYLAWAKSVKGVEAFFGGYSVQELQTVLKQASMYDGLSLIHVPVYYGDDELGGMGVFGRWNVGNWCDDVQRLRHKIGL